MTHELQDRTVDFITGPFLTEGKSLYAKEVKAFSNAETAIDDVQKIFKQMKKQIDSDNFRGGDKLNSGPHSQPKYKPWEDELNAPEKIQTLLVKAKRAITEANDLMIDFDDFWSSGKLFK